MWGPFLEYLDLFTLVGRWQLLSISFINPNLINFIFGEQLMIPSIYDALVPLYMNWRHPLVGEALPNGVRGQVGPGGTAKPDYNYADKADMVQLL